MSEKIRYPGFEWMELSLASLNDSSHGVDREVERIHSADDEEPSEDYVPLMEEYDSR